MGFKFTNPINGDKYRVEESANVLVKKGSGKPAGFNNEHKPLVKRLDFVPPMQAATLKDRFSCEEKDYFISSYTKVADNWEALPTVDDPVGEKHTAGVKFFDNQYSFYVFQRPTADKPWMFCYTVDQDG